MHQVHLCGQARFPIYHARPPHEQRECNAIPWLLKHIMRTQNFIPRPLGCWPYRKQQTSTSKTIELTSLSSTGWEAPGTAGQKGCGTAGASQDSLQQ